MSRCSAIVGAQLTIDLSFRPGLTLASTNPVLHTRATDAPGVGCGAYLAKPQTDFRAATFHALTQDDVDYFHMMIDSHVLDTVLRLQDRLFECSGTSYRRLVCELARKNTIAAWALTALTQTDRATRRSCFLHMALAYKELPCGVLQNSTFWKY